MSPSHQTLRCSDLLGMPYRLGGDGSDGTIDCINLVYAALNEQGIKCPAFKSSWYEQTPRQYLRDLLVWGNRICTPYNGDVLWKPGTGPVFAAIWENGILHINESRNAVHWLPVGVLLTQSSFRCFRMKGT